MSAFGLDNIFCASSLKIFAAVWRAIPDEAAKGTLGDAGSSYSFWLLLVVRLTMMEARRPGASRYMALTICCAEFREAVDQFLDDDTANRSVVPDGF